MKPILQRWLVRISNYHVMTKQVKIICTSQYHIKLFCVGITRTEVIICILLLLFTFSNVNNEDVRIPDITIFHCLQKFKIQD